MISKENFNCISEKARILTKKIDDRFFTYLNIEKIIKALNEKSELFILNAENMTEKIKKIEYIGLQDFLEIKTFSGSKVQLGKDTDIFVDDEWITAKEVRFHEEIFEYNIIHNHFNESFIIKIHDYKKLKAYQIFTENNKGLVINNFLIRFLPD